MFGKFMNKKFFHPGSYPNQKQKWIHQQRADAKEKLENEKQTTYQKEQETYQSRLLSAKTKEEKLKLDLNFLYDVPPGMKKENEEDEGEEKEVKFEWQKNAPRSKYVKDLGLECQDQPFGICVKNIRCFKCKKWGHQNTDRECPLFFTDIPTSGSSGKSQADSLRLSDPLRLVAAMKSQHGLTLKKSVIGAEIDPMAENQQLLDSDEEGEGNLDDTDMAYIASLNDKEKKKLLKALNKIQKKNKKRKKKKKHKSQESPESEDYNVRRSSNKQNDPSSSSDEGKTLSKGRNRRDSFTHRKNKIHPNNENPTHKHRRDRKRSYDEFHRDNKTKQQRSPRSYKRKRDNDFDSDDADDVTKLISECRYESKTKRKRR